MKFIVTNKSTNKKYTVNASKKVVKDDKLSIHKNSIKLNDSDEKLELNKEEIDSLKELAKLLPELKEMLKNKKEDIILEENEEDEEEDLEEEDLEEEDIISDECNYSTKDSKASIFSIEKPFSSKITDSSDKELNVAQAFDSRYSKLLNK